MFEKLIPFDSIIGIDYQHLSYDIFYLWVHFMRKDNRIFFDFFEQIDDV